MTHIFTSQIVYRCSNNGRSWSKFDVANPGRFEFEKKIELSARQKRALNRIFHYKIELYILSLHYVLFLSHI